MTTTDTSKIITSPPNQYKRPVTITFDFLKQQFYVCNATNNKNVKDTSIITNTTEDFNSYPPLSNSYTSSTWKDYVSNMIRDMKEDIMNQFEKLLLEKMKESIRKMKGQ